MIRRATPADAPAITKIMNDVIAQPHITFRTAPKPPKEVAAMIEGPAPVWVASEGAIVTGYATYGPFRGSDGYARSLEHSIALRPAARGKGQGRALMAALMEDARTAGCRVMVAGISAANPNAIAFHASLGFENAGLLRNVGHKGGAWHDLVFMTRDLSAAR